MAAKVVHVPGSECDWWVGAISGRGHGRFWVGPGHVVIAHRFAFAMTYGLEALDLAPLLGHRCDNPLCQRIGDGHVVVSTARENRREWVQRRNLVDSPLADPRGSRSRAEVLRSLTRVDPPTCQGERRNRAGQGVPSRTTELVVGPAVPALTGGVGPSPGTHFLSASGNCGPGESLGLRRLVARK